MFCLFFCFLFWFILHISLPISGFFVYFPESGSEGFLLCRSSAGAKLSFRGGCRGDAGEMPPRCRRIDFVRRRGTSEPSGVGDGPMGPGPYGPMGPWPWPQKKNGEFEGRSPSRILRGGCVGGRSTPPLRRIRVHGPGPIWAQMGPKISQKSQKSPNPPRTGVRTPKPRALL